MHLEAFRRCLQEKYNPREPELMLKQKTILTNKHHAVKIQEHLLPIMLYTGNDCMFLFIVRKLF